MDDHGEFLTPEGKHMISIVRDAIKVSSKKPDACVWIESTESTDEVTYSVRDNGAVFDMEYANKLFEVFQRLHRQDGFEGTGQVPNRIRWSKAPVRRVHLSIDCR